MGGTLGNGLRDCTFQLSSVALHAAPLASISPHHISLQLGHRQGRVDQGGRGHEQRQRREDEGEQLHGSCRCRHVDRLRDEGGDREAGLIGNDLSTQM